MVRQELQYNQVFDEASHIACGMEWLSLGTYHYEALHPPLARAATALPLFLEGLRSEGHANMAVEGSSLLASGNYQHNLLLSRLGVMPFFWSANILICLWARRHFGTHCALIAVILFCFCPPVIAHSALSTTDAPFMSLYLLATLAVAHLVRRPSLRRGSLAFFCFGLALMSKFTALPFMVLTFMPLLFWYGRTGQQWRSLINPVAVGLLTLSLTIWGTYHFSIGTFFTPATIYPNAQHKLAAAQPFVRHVFLEQRIPAPDFFRGVYSAFLAGAKQKRVGYLLGRSYTGGRWYFFPVAILAKMPLAFLTFAVVGLATILAGSRRFSYETAVLLGGVGGPLVIAMVGDINLGLRHVLPLCPFLAMIAALGAARLFGVLPRAAAYPLIVGDTTSSLSFGRRGPLTASLLISWQVTACLAATPQFLPYFNEAFRPFDSYVLVDSDLDWGQDFYHLQERLKDVPPPEVSIGYFGDNTIPNFGSMGWKTLEPKTPVTGWVALSESMYRRQSSDFEWLNGRPFERVGRSIRLYSIPPRL